MTKQLITVLDQIKTIMPNSSLEEPFIEAVLQRLDSFGYRPKKDDGWALCFAMQMVETRIKNSCNTPSIPNGLFYVAVDLVCGEFLLAKKQTGKLDDVFDLETAIKTVVAGDTTVTFMEDGTSPDQRLDSFLSYLLRKGKDDFVCCRKIKW